MKLFFTLVFFSSLNLWAVEYKGVEYPPQTKLGKTELVLNGLGLRTATIFNVKVYTIGLYLKSKSNDGDKIIASAEPKEFLMHFLRDVDKSDIVSAWNETLTKYCKGEECKTLKPKMDELNNLMSDIKENQKMSYQYFDGKTQVVIDGKVKGVVEGEAFAKLTQKAWLHKKSDYKKLRKDILGIK